MNNFKIIMPCYNVEQWIENNINSILNQNYNNWKAIIIDDNSTDKTLEKIKNLLKNSNYKKQFKILHRNNNVGALENIVYGINNICENDEDIIVLLDGDDYLASNDVLEYLNNIYQDKNIWLTYGQYQNLSDGKLGCCAPLQSTINYRKEIRWCTSHLRTFKYKIWKCIKDEDLRDKYNNYYSMTWDQAILFPLIEMCGINRIKFIDKIMYIYNNLNPNNDFKKNLLYQISLEKEIRSKPQYHILNSLDINNKINSIIFSKDRACQLDLLLRSIKKFVVNYKEFDFKILFQVSNNQFLDGYNKLINLHKEFNFLKQTDFKSNVISLINPNKPYTIFGVDDDVFIDIFDINSKEFTIFESNNKILSLSLRMGQRINYCYTLDITTPAPQYEKENIWNWQKCQGDWGYPMSIDFNIFKTFDIFSIIQNTNYINPNYLEAFLATKPNMDKPLMISYNQPKVFGIPANKSQTTHNNRSGNISLEELNNKFLSGKIISLDKIINIKNNSPHMEINYEFEDVK